MTRRVLAVLALAGALTGLWTAPTLAGPTRDDVMANAQRCAAFTDDHTWLNCYYGAAQPMRAQLGLPPAPDSQVNLLKNTPAPSPTTNTARRSGTGWFDGIIDFFDTSTPQSDSDFGAGAVRLASYSFDKGGLFTVTLPNGQVWTQSPYDTLRARWSGPATNYTVIVLSETMGSSTMRVKDGHDYRVVRVK
jgi:hypothetical protein